MLTCVVRVIADTRDMNIFLPCMTETEAFQRQIELPITKENDIIVGEENKIAQNSYYTWGNKYSRNIGCQ